MYFSSASACDLGKKRISNEDALLDRTDLAIWAVADGMGGHEAGEVASARIVEALAELGSEGTLESVAAETDRLLHEVNGELLEMAWGCGRPSTIGSTVVMLAIRNGRYVCLWAGDSRCYLIRGHSITQVTQDHSLVWDLVRSGMLDEAEAATHPDANVITRAIGAKRDLKIDVTSGSTEAGDHFLLVTDGVSRMLSDDELCRIIASRNPGQAVDEITETVLARGAPDNLSTIVVRVY
ncbi:SpoIIE family protein phosphatase [Altererythrobacter salegens]|uniref:SpoIIE family protein phosphatase n=1 Tax=Croceibacterium salegens TaxID=1737568 RepID=A0A6I4T0Q6_9SPHN|nr:protein phosphatase 2C domain-containing protein [Croceibacterium salegens]MXO60837.1 SpoIIE family protein phosphatase [Croceibacterium salegens]